MIKTVIYFILLKVLEIGGVALSYYGLCHLVTIVFGNDDMFWFNGIVALVCLLLGIATGLALIIFIQYNWGLAKKFSSPLKTHKFKV